MGLLITLYLIKSNVYGSISSTIAPPKRGFSYIEVWMIGIVMTISFAILEYFFILAFKRRNKMTNPEDIIQLIDFISRPDTKLELHKKEPTKLELQKNELTKLELHKLEPMQKRTLWFWA